MSSSSAFQSFMEEYDAKQVQLLNELQDAKRRLDMISARQRRHRRRELRRRGLTGLEEPEDLEAQLQAALNSTQRRRQQQEEGSEQQRQEEDNGAGGDNQSAVAVAEQGGGDNNNNNNNNDGITEEEMQQLIMRALGLYEEYYEQRSRVAHMNVFQLFSSAWSTSLECAFYWIAGFRPTAMFSLVNTAVDDLSPEQILRIQSLMAQTKLEERALSEDLAKVQESIAAPPLVELAKRAGRRYLAGRGGGLQPNEALETLQVAMETLLANADSLRTTTAANVVEILNTTQNIRFLTAATQLQRNLKIWGLELDGSGIQRARG